jgi:hypothetical protein
MGGRLEITRLLVESKADVAARDWCFSPPPSRHLSITIRLAAVGELHSKSPSPTLLHTCAASALLNDANQINADTQLLGGYRDIGMKLQVGFTLMANGDVKFAPCCQWSDKSCKFKVILLWLLVHL